MKDKRIKEEDLEKVVAGDRIDGLEEFDWRDKGYPTPIKPKNLKPGETDFQPIGDHSKD